MVAGRFRRFSTLPGELARRSPKDAAKPGGGLHASHALRGIIQFLVAWGTKKCPSVLRSSDRSLLPKGKRTPCRPKTAHEPLAAAGSARTFSWRVSMMVGIRKPVKVKVESSWSGRLPGSHDSRPTGRGPSRDFYRELHESSSGSSTKVIKSAMFS